MDQFTMAEFAKSSENKEGAGFTPEVQESGIQQGSLIVSALYNTMLGNITKCLRDWNAELVNLLNASSITPSADSSTQIYTAIKKLIEKSHGRNVGDVYFSYSSSATDNPGGLPLFTGEVIASADTLYPEFYGWLVAHPAICTSETSWQSSIATYGECPKYVVDTTNKTIRLPKLVNYLKMANTTDGITISSAGLPNITGTFVHDVGNTSAYVTGAFYVERPVPANTSNLGGETDHLFRFDASRSNPIYGNSNTVTPAHTTLFPWVCAYNEAVPASTAQAAEFQQALSEKVDKADLDEVQCIVETYVNGASWYRVWSDGWCEQGGSYAVTNDNNTHTITLLKTMANTNYFVSFTKTVQANATGNASPAYIGDVTVVTGTLTTTSFTIARGYNSPVIWNVCGYIN